jgi:putative thioredoxin
MLAPRLEKAINARNGAIVLAKINTDENQELAMRFRIEGIPDVRAFRDGKEVLSFQGLLPEAQIEDFLNRIMPTAGDTALKEAVAKEKTQPAEAEAAYRTVLEKERDNAKALLGLTRLLVAKNAADEAAELLERFVGSGDDATEAEALRAVVALRQLGKGLPDAPTLRGKADQSPEVRYQLGLALAAEGRYPEALDEFIAAAEKDKELAKTKVKEAMVHIFRIIGTRSELADEYRDRLSRLLY